MKPKLHLEIHRLGPERGMISIWVSVILLAVSWVAATLYLQITLGLKMAMNSEAQLTQQVQADNQVIHTLQSIQDALNKDFQQDPLSYLLKFRQRFPNDLLGCVSRDNLSSDCTVEGRAICKRVVGVYDITYAFPVLIPIMPVEPQEHSLTQAPAYYGNTNIEIRMLSYIARDL